jgi:hypothetical protein
MSKILIAVLLISLSFNVLAAKPSLKMKKVSQKEYDLGKAYTIKKLKIDGTECIVLVGKYQTSPALSCDW